MENLSVPEAVATLLDSISSQAGVITTLAYTVIGAIIFISLRGLGLLTDTNFGKFMRINLLFFPGIFCVFAVIIGFLINAQMTGYYTEVALGIDSTTGEPIVDPRAYYFVSYETLLHYFSLSQLILCMLGCLFFAAWFWWNLKQLKE